MSRGIALPLAIAFALGWAVGSRSTSAPEGALPQAIASSETSDSATGPRPSVRARAVDSADSDRVESSASAAAPAATERDPLEKLLAGIPFAELKRVFLERQDAEYERTQERYGELNGIAEEDLERRSNEFFESYRRGAGGSSFFVATGEWRLKGKTYSVEVHTNFFASRGERPQPVGPDAEEPAGAARSARELNQFTSFYVRLGDSYASEGSGGSLFSPAVRDGAPYVMVHSYSKDLTPVFDQISIPLPVAGDEGTPEVYDSVTGKWSSLPRLSWAAVDKETFDRREADLRKRD